MVNMKRNDRNMVKEIRAFREQLARSGDVTADEIRFAQVEEFQATKREHADATFPLYQEHELRVKLWNEEKRSHNVEGDDEELIIGVAHRIQTLEGGIRQIFFEEIAHDKTAGDAKNHQDRLNSGGIKKSAKLQHIEKTPGLKQKHQRKLRAIKKRAGVR
jgi:hypothetical protein